MMGFPPLLCWGYLQFLRYPFSGISPEKHLDHLIPASRGQIAIFMKNMITSAMVTRSTDTQKGWQKSRYKDRITLLFLNLTALSQVISGHNMRKHALLRQVSRSKSGPLGSSAVMKKLKEMAISWFAHLKYLSICFLVSSHQKLLDHFRLFL